MFENIACSTGLLWSLQRFIRQVTWRSCINTSCTGPMTKSSRISLSRTRRILSLSPLGLTARPSSLACVPGRAWKVKSMRRSLRNLLLSKICSQKSSQRFLLTTGSIYWTSITRSYSNSSNSNLELEGKLCMASKWANLLGMVSCKTLIIKHKMISRSHPNSTRAFWVSKDSLGSLLPSNRCLQDPHNKTK